MMINRIRDSHQFFWPGVLRMWCGTAGNSLPGGAVGTHIVGSVMLISPYYDHIKLSHDIPWAWFVIIRWRKGWCHDFHVRRVLVKKYWKTDDEVVAFRSFPAFWFENLGWFVKNRPSWRASLLKCSSRRFQPSMQWSCLRPCDMSPAICAWSKVTQDQSEHIFLESPNHPKKQRIKKPSTAESSIYSIGFLVGKAGVRSFQNLGYRMLLSADAFPKRCKCICHPADQQYDVNLLGDGRKRHDIKVNLSTRPHAAG